MDKLHIIMTTFTAVLGFVLTVLIPFAVKVCVALKQGKAEITKTAQDKLKAEAAEKNAAQKLELTRAANEIIESLEKTFATQDYVLKTYDPSRTLGPVKKECALARLSEVAAEKGAEFDRDYWANEIDEIVRMTRNVNAKSAA